MNRFLFTLISAFGMAFGFASGAQAQPDASALRGDQAFTCVDDQQQPLISVSTPDDKGTRWIEFLGIYAERGRVHFEYCVDTSKNEDPFGTDSGSLGCFDSKFDPEYKVLVLLNSGLDGDAGELIITNPRTLQLVSRGVCHQSNN